MIKKKILKNLVIFSDKTSELFLNHKKPSCIILVLLLLFRWRVAYVNQIKIESLFQKKIVEDFICDSSLV